MNEKIDEYVAGLPAWQSQNLGVFRELVHEAVPTIHEDWKWSVPVFTYGGKILFAMSGFKGHTKFNFLTGAGLADQSGFNSGLDSKQHRGINLAEGEAIDSVFINKALGEAVARATT